MTTPDLRAAAERLIICAYDANGLIEEGGKKFSQAMDGHYVGKAYRAMAADLDPTPIDKETEPVEFTDALGCKCSWMIVRSLSDPSCFVLSLCQEKFSGSGLNNGDLVAFKVTTLGDLRRLCRALGVGLT